MPRPIGNLGVFHSRGILLIASARERCVVLQLEAYFFQPFRSGAFAGDPDSCEVSLAILPPPQTALPRVD